MSVAGYTAEVGSCSTPQLVPPQTNTENHKISTFAQSELTHIPHSSVTFIQISPNHLLFLLPFSHSHSTQDMMKHAALAKKAHSELQVALESMLKVLKNLNDSLHVLGVKGFPVSYRTQFLTLSCKAPVGHMPTLSCRTHPHLVV